MERSSYFIDNKALFGSYPLQEQVNKFESMGVRYFVDLTCEGEKKIIPYKTRYNYLRYPIPDRRVPTNWGSFSSFVMKVGKIVRKLGSKESVYIHCKGGHGRSGVLVACLLCYLYGMDPSEALSETSLCHGRRVEMREKWRKMGSPQTRSQKHFVSKFFEPLCVYNNYTKYFSSGFSNDAAISVMVPGFGLFPTAASAFNAFKNPVDTEYVKKLELVTDIEDINDIISEYPDDKEWCKIREEVMYKVLKLKFGQNDVIRSQLLNTGLRPIIVRTTDLYWGKLDNSGKNMLGKMLVKLRKKLYNTIT